MLPMGGMCYLNEWPKSFLKAVIRHYSHHQVKKIKKRWGLPPCRGADTVAAPLDMGDVAMGVSGSTAATRCIAILRVTMRVHLPGDKAGPATPGCAEVLL